MNRAAFVFGLTTIVELRVLFRQRKIGNELFYKVHGVIWEGVEL